LPNVLVEAQSQSLACISTPVSGIPELLGHGISGLLVPPDDAPALAAGLLNLASDPDLRLQLGKAGARRVFQTFDQNRAAADLMVLFAGEALPATARADRAVTVEPDQKIA
jgi:glycosyltransferase involved in cell wall biosynthesis